MASEDEKIQKLIEKEVTKALKSERARILDIMKALSIELKSATDEVKNPEAGV